jgi:hypothetical protein
VNDKSNAAAETIETRQRDIFMEEKDLGRGRPATQFPKTWHSECEAADQQALLCYPIRADTVYPANFPCPCRK